MYIALLKRRRISTGDRTMVPKRKGSVSEHAYILLYMDQANRITGYSALGNISG
jgi:hypothetical protein